MAEALNPITDAEVLAIDPNAEPERRVQSLWHAWLQGYFTGSSFRTRKADGTTERKTFVKAKVVWGEAGMDDEALPLIHGVLIDSNSSRRDRAGATLGYDTDWSLQLMVKVPNNVTGRNRAERHPSFVARRLADQLAWLIGGSERASLVEQGIINVRVTSGPEFLPTSSFQARIMLVQFRTRREIPRL